MARCPRAASPQARKRLAYLLQQSDVFSTFGVTKDKAAAMVDGSSASSSSSSSLAAAGAKAKGKGGGGAPSSPAKRRERMPSAGGAEDEEDAANPDATASATYLLAQVRCGGDAKERRRSDAVPLSAGSLWAW